MKQKMKRKMGIDVLMTVLLLCLMAYQITGEKLHEWFGMGMLVLFVAHNVLNFRWYKNLFRGKYRLSRFVQTVVNISVLVSMLCLGYSGIVMSRHVFALLPISGPMATARKMHMAASYWGFVLMSIHLGMHWNMVMGMFRKLLKGKKVSGIAIWSLRTAAIAIAVVGCFQFVQKDIISYMFLEKEFVFFDFQQNAAEVFAEYMMMMGAWVFVGFYLTKGIRILEGARGSKR